MAPRSALVTIVTLVALAGRADAGDPERVWWTLETDHFVIHYYDPLGEVAQRVAQVAERAHRTLSPALQRSPEEKTEVVLVDDTDGANGFASVLPRNRITLFATAPIGESSLNDHDDWLYALTGHEYTHILHLDTIGGLPRVLNKVLGKTWSPNQIQPRWIIEGLATYQESRRSSSGRTRSNLFDMFVRSAVLGGEDLSLDEVTNGPFAFPRGNAAYLYGGKFLQYVFDRVGDDKAGAMSWTSGTNPVPYGVNRQIHAVTGVTFQELWSDWKVWLRDRYTLQLEAVERAGRREGRRLTFDTEGHLSPQYSADGKELVWLSNDGVSDSKLRTMPVGGNVGDAKDLMRLERLGGWCLLADGSIVYEQTWTHRIDYDFQDLFLWDRPTRRTIRLTRGLRARDPAVSPDGEQVAFAINGESHMRLAVMPLVPDAEPRVLHEGARWDQSFQPAWSPDGARIAFVGWREGGFRDLLLVDVASGEVTELTHDRAIDGDPTWSPDGRHLYFSSDRTGIYNIYALEVATGALWQVTNVVGGAFDPSVSPDGTRLAYHGFDGTGYDVFEIELDPERWTVARPYVDDRPAPTAIADDEAVVRGPRPYRALETIGPEAWRAELALDSAGDSTVTVRTSGSDVAGLHAWSVAATMRLDDARVNLGANYGYGGWRIPVRAAFGRNIADREGFRVDGISRPYTEESLGATLAFNLPTRRGPESSLTFSADVDVDYVRLVDEPPPDEVLDPNDIMPRRPVSDYFQSGFALRGAWNTARGHAETLGTVEGHELAFSVRYDDPAFGAEYRNLTLGWTYRVYKRLPWGVTPALSLRYAGGVRATDLDRGSAYGLGGTPEQDVAGSILGLARVGTTGYLRGYEPRVVQGDAYHLANLEYRQRLWQIERGIATLPLYLRRLHVAGLFDAGTAYDDFEPEDVKLSVGAALRLDVVLGYFAPGSFEVGYSRGLSADGIDETWFLLTTIL